MRISVRGNADDGGGPSNTLFHQPNLMDLHTLL
jgi:hypothetical protein